MDAKSRGKFWWRAGYLHDLPDCSLAVRRQNYNVTVEKSDILPRWSKLTLLVITLTFSTNANLGGHTIT